MPPTECLQLQVSLDRLRGLLEALVVRGLRACGEDELTQLKGYVDELELAGAGTVAGVLAELYAHIQSGEREGPRTLIRGLTAVRMLERLLTLRVAKLAYKATDDFENEPSSADGGAE